MMKTAKMSTWLALALLPVAVLLLGRHFGLVFFAGMAAVPLMLFLAAGHWPVRRLLRWCALGLNGLVALVMVPAFVYMLVKVDAPPSLTAVLPVLAVAQVLLIAPVLNAMALWPRMGRARPSPAAG